jgi:hypothetical protein
LSEHGDFRRDPRDAREQAAERDVPERREGAEPADDDSPEFSRGQPLDDPQPSAREREELQSGQDDPPAADVDSDLRHTRVSSDRVYLEALLEGVPLPATKSDLITYAQRSGGGRAAQLLKSLPEGRYDWLDQVGEALAPVQPKWRRERRVPKAESGLPPGGPGYGINGGKTT